MPDYQLLTLTPHETDTQNRLKYVTVNGVKSPVFQVIQGSARLTASGAGQILAAVLGSDTGTIWFLSNAAGTAIRLGFDSNNKRIVGVAAGGATLSDYSFAATQ